MAMSRDRFHWADYMVLAAMLVVSLAIGLYQAFTGGKQKTKTEYLMANRSMRVLPVTLSVVSSFISAVMVLGAVPEVYTRGTMFILFGAGASMAAIVSALLFVPTIYPLQLTSAFEYLEKRFQSKCARITGDLLLLTSTIGYMGIAAYAPATALTMVTGLPSWALLCCIGVVATTYTTLGGIRAVVWTDTFQSVVMVGGLVAVIVIGTMEVGGVAEVWNVNGRGGRLLLWEFDPDPTIRHSFWTLVIGGAMTWMQALSVHQAAVQRMGSMPTLANARLMVALAGPCVTVLYVLCVISGCVVYAYFTKVIGCDPMTSKKINNPNQILPYFIMQVLAYPGIPGLFVACLLSGALSTISTGMNSMAAMVWEDMLKTTRLGRLSNSRQLITIKILAMLFGCVGLLMSFATQYMPGHILQVSTAFNGSTMGPVLGMFLLGGLFPCSNWLGATIGGVAGLAMSMWITVGASIVRPYTPVLNFTTANCSENTTITEIFAGNDDILGWKRTYATSYLWYSSVGAFTTVLVGLLVSCVTGCTDPRDVDPHLLFHIGDRLCCLLPEKTLRVLRYGNVRAVSKEDLRPIPLDLFKDRGNTNASYRPEDGEKATIE